MAAIPVERKKEEALRRMRSIGIFDQTIDQFDRDGYVSVSEPPFGAWFWVSEDERAELDRFEKNNDALVYAVIRSYTNFGKMDTYMYVSDYEEEWEQDRDDIQEGRALCYVANRDMPDCSEFGSIGFERTFAAGLKRTW